MKPHHSSPSLRDRYEQQVRSGQLQGDAAQREVVELLEGFHEQLQRRPKQLGFFRKAPKTKQSSGVYIYGAVGRGKSMLMDLFYHTLEHPKKRRVHFHAFMADIHHQLHSLRKHHTQGDPLVRLAEGLTRETRILFLDEMQVTDITDAMLLGRIF